MKEKKFPIFVFSLVFAFLVWVSVNLGNTFQTTLDLPVSVENLPPSLAIASPLPDHIRVRIQATGWQLINAFLSPNIRYTIDLRHTDRKDTILTDQRVSERMNIPSEIRIFGTDPDTILIALDRKITRMIPLQPRLNVSFRDGFGIVGHVRTEPESIAVTGARSLLTKVTAWPTQSVSLNDINAPVTLVAPLVDTLSFETARNQTSVKILFDVQPIAEKTIDNIPLEVNQVPENRNVVLIPPTVSIIIRSGVNTIAPLTEKDFYAFIDYKSILLDTSGYVQPIILGPDDIKIVQQHPERIQYVVRK